MAGGGHAGLVAVTAEVVVVANQALEPPTSEVSLHTGITRHSFVSGHSKRFINLKRKVSIRKERSISINFRLS